MPRSSSRANRGPPARACPTPSRGPSAHAGPGAPQVTSRPRSRARRRPGAVRRAASPRPAGTRLRHQVWPPRASVETRASRLALGRRPPHLTLPRWRARHRTPPRAWPGPAARRRGRRKRPPERSGGAAALLDGLARAGRVALPKGSAVAPAAAAARRRCAAAPRRGPRRRKWTARWTERPALTAAPVVLVPGVRHDSRADPLHADV
jgi:hypothetical protein